MCKVAGIQITNVVINVNYLASMYANLKFANLAYSNTQLQLNTVFKLPTYRRSCLTGFNATKYLYRLFYHFFAKKEKCSAWK